MKYTVMELLWLLFVYSFLGWIIETGVGTIRKKKFINRGFSTGPFCMVYGIAAVCMTVYMEELTDRTGFLFIGCGMIATVVEWVTGKILEKFNQRKWWDYSDKKWNFDGYICLQYSLLWAVLGVCTVKFGDRFFVEIYHLLPELLREIIIWILLAVGILDLLASFAAVLHIKYSKSYMISWNQKATVWLQRAVQGIVRCVEHRMVKAYPMILDTVDQAQERGRFAQGCGFYKLFWLFVIGALLGDITETLFCRVTAGVWMSRSSLVWGPFSIVWGLAMAMATALLYRDREKPDRHIFIIGTLLGGIYEYICSVFTELVFGKVFWDYSRIPFNLGGRINLLYCFFWGIAAVVWIKGLYPRFSEWIEKIPVVWGYIMTWILVIFMAANILMSAAALIRYDSRGKGIPASSGWEEFLDEHFDDARMERIYPNAKSTQ